MMVYKMLELKEFSKTLVGKSEEEISNLLIKYEEAQMNRSKYITGRTSRFDFLDFELIWVIKGLENVEQELGLSEDFDPCETACKNEFDDLLKRLKDAYREDLLCFAKARRRELEKCLEKTTKELERINNEILTLEHVAEV